MIGERVIKINEYTALNLAIGLGLDPEMWPTIVKLLNEIYESQPPMERLKYFTRANKVTNA